jgi:hypothetical protein
VWDPPNTRWVDWLHYLQLCGILQIQDGLIDNPQLRLPFLHTISNHPSLRHNLTYVIMSQLCTNKLHSKTSLNNVLMNMYGSFEWVTRFVNAYKASRKVTDSVSSPFLLHFAKRIVPMTSVLSHISHVQ